MSLTIRDANSCKYDLVSLGECMIRLSPPGHGRVEFTPTLEVWVGGGEYNVSYALARLGERLALSQSASDETKWLTLLVLAALTLVALGLVHTEYPAAQATVLTTFSLAMVTTLGLIALHERPFDGPLAMSAEPLVIARAAVAGPAP